MPSGLINLALGLALQVGPGPSEAPNFPAPIRASGQYGFEGSAEQRHPADSQMNWVHGYYQAIPAYGGHHVYRPYNYKDVLSQSQTAAGWGERPMMPYSQQFWHKYQDQAAMLKVSRSQSVPLPYQNGVPVPSAVYFAPQTPGWTVQPSGLHLPSQQPVSFQPASQNTVTTPISVPETLQAPPLGEFNQIRYQR